MSSGIFFSDSRLGVYTGGFDEYILNIKYSQYFYPILHLFEISLRNRLNDFYKTEFNDENWLIHDHGEIDSRFVKQIKEVRDDLTKKRKQLTQDNMVSAFSLGFWVDWFHPAYYRHYEIAKVQVTKLFKFSTKTANPDNIHRELLLIRDFRNRVFHFEKVINNPKYKDIYKLIRKYLLKLDNDAFLNNTLERLNKNGPEELLKIIAPIIIRN